MKLHSEVQYQRSVFPALNLFFNRRTKVRKKMPPAQFDLAAPLQAWWRQLCAELEQCDPPGQLCLGTTRLLTRADAQLVVQIDAGSLHQLIDSASQAAEREGLVAVLARDGDGARIALFNPVADPSHRQWLFVALRTGVASRRPGQSATARSRRRKPLLFAVSGPDGVGKTTLIEAMKPILAGYPLPVSYIHPTTLVKDAAWIRRNTGRSGGAAPAAAPERRVSLARAAWRQFALPVLRRAATVLIGELNYAHRVNRTIREEALANRIIISDRYVYDRLVKMPLLRKEPVQMWAISLNCRLMASPRLTLILSDASENIHWRKPELTSKEIADYEGKLLATCAHYGAPHRVVTVSGRTPAALAAEVIVLLLGAAGEELFAVLDAGLRANAHSAVAGA